MITRCRFSKIIGILLFIIVELMVIWSNLFPFYLTLHKPMHIIFTVCFLLCHMLLCIVVKQPSFCMFLLSYWTTNLFLRIYQILFMRGPIFIRIIHPFCVVISYFFPGTSMLYFPGTTSNHGMAFSNGYVLLNFLSIILFLIFARKSKSAESL